MKLKELQTLLENQPSISSNTFLVSALYLLSWILACGFLLSGILLLLEAFLNWKILLYWLSAQIKLVLTAEQRIHIALSFGIISIFLSVLFGGMIFLCRMILKRNSYIITLDDWIFNNITDLKKPSKKTSK